MSDDRAPGATFRWRHELTRGIINAIGTAVLLAFFFVATLLVGESSFRDSVLDEVSVRPVPPVALWLCERSPRPYPTSNACRRW